MLHPGEWVQCADAPARRPVFTRANEFNGGQDQRLELFPPISTPSGSQLYDGLAPSLRLRGGSALYLVRGIAAQRAGPAAATR